MSEKRINAILKSAIRAKTNADKPQWQPELTLQIREGQWGDSQGAWHIKPVHNPKNLGHEILTHWNETYRPMFYILGLARNNELLMEFGKKSALKENDALNLFNAAKHIFHRLHFPGREFSIVYASQLISALAKSNKGYLTIHSTENCNNSIKIENDYNEFIDKVVLSEEIILKRWSIKGKVNEFIPALQQLCTELSVGGMDKATLQEKIVIINNDSCQIKFRCDGAKFFSETKFHRNEAQTNGFTLSEHGFTHAIITLENCLQAFLKKDSLDAFSYTLEQNDNIIFSIKLDAPHAVEES